MTGHYVKRMDPQKRQPTTTTSSPNFIWKFANNDDRDTRYTSNNFVEVSSVSDSTTPLLVSQPHSYASIKKTNVRVKSSTGMVVWQWHGHLQF